MVRLVALVELPYDGINRVPGTPSAEFDASEKDADLLKLIGKAADAPKTDEPVKGDGLFTRESKAEEPASDKPATRKRYLRRDMQAEDGQ